MPDRLRETDAAFLAAEPRVLAIGVSSYNGGVFYGLNADRDALRDADVLGQCVTEALEVLSTPPAPAAPVHRAGGLDHEVIRTIARCPIAKFTWPSCRYRRPTSPLRCT